MLLAQTTAEGSVKIVPLAMNVNLTAVDVLHPAQAKLTAVNFAPDGKQLVTAGENGTVLVWEVPPRWKEVKGLQKLKKEELHARWEDLYNREANYFHTMLQLAAEPDVAIALFRDKLKERPAADEKQVAAWMDEVLSGKRPQALDDVVEAGPKLSTPAISKAWRGLVDKQVALRNRLGQLLEVDDRLIGHRDLRRMRVIEILERIGTAEARVLVETLAKGPAESVVTRHAKAALVRMPPK